MDIIVTIPKREMSNIQKEDEFINLNKGEVQQAWSIGRIPKQLKSGDKVYFIENSVIKYYHEFIKIEKDFYCEVTHRTWHGLNLILKCPEVKLKNPVQMRGFQGFRYTERIE